MSAVAIVGGGWAGLAAGVELADAGIPVTLCESAKQLGGRARRVDWNELAIDNGQHLMVGAYRETLRLMARIGTLDTLDRCGLDLRVPGFRLHLPDIPAPLHLAAGLMKAAGLNWSEKWAATRFMRHLQARQFKLDRDQTAAALLSSQHQPSDLIAKLWEPLCVAALNTPLDQASAQVFCNVLRDSLAGPRDASDLIFNRSDIGAAFPDAAVAYMAGRGGDIRLGAKVTAIEAMTGGFRLRGMEIEAQRVIVAVHPARLGALVAGLPALAVTVAGVAGYAWQPILTLWLRFTAAVPLPFPMLGLGPGQAPWVFDRNAVAPGLLSVVFSAEGPHLNQAPESLRDDCLALITTQFGPLPELLDWKIITEKRATFACLPDMFRPENRTALPGLYLAGDYIEADYPATLEGAVRSGVKCARLLMDDL
jgi:squalene-associated FAD-dependent desaturase